MKKPTSTVWTEENANTICARLVAGESLRKICEDKSLPSYDTVLDWAANDEEFGNQYDRARKIQYQRWADEIIDLSDDSSGDFKQDERGNRIPDYENVQRSRLRVDSRKWILSKLLPKQFGDRPNEVNVSTSVTNNNLILTEVFLKQLQEWREEALRE